ncbi:Metallo-hydrolase/oxidoreductase [Cylindrobasidium torrendii FP15055 ss-10]|uniref:Metallo-hydrolase/oxidoreductase n=1 Tax=Cylindrobasidium torrendii FP15055 ss-10 TaxID=1314674 RepID=A0A0D7BRP2_9AGAR|nr:Metallo-hydrolase/oxidoreductase [Cylindrobasidium torrendii FP15055 ss-10]
MSLEAVTRLSDSVVRVLGKNPGQFTLHGTNTYLVGRTNPYLLIDTGEGRPEYLPLLEHTLLHGAPDVDRQKPLISDIIISHWHLDHIGGLPDVLGLLKKLNSPPPRLHKYPLPPDAVLRTHRKTSSFPEIVASLQSGTFAASPDGTPFHDLKHGQVLNGLRVLHTPGHTLDSICLHIPEDRALYTADTVLGAGSSVFEDLASYMVSLASILSFVKGDTEPSSLSSDKLYPGHGPVVTSPERWVAMYIRHREEREVQVLDTLSKLAENVSRSTMGIVQDLYKDVPEEMWVPASYSIGMHLEKLEKDGKVKRTGQHLVERQHIEWILVR